MTAKRRRTTEFGIIVPLDRMALAAPRALRNQNVSQSLRQYADECHLYLVGRRPKTCIEPHSVSIDDGLLTARFISRVNSEEAIVDCRWTRHNFKNDVHIDSPWPHNIVTILDADGGLVLRCNASLLLAQAMMYTKSDEQRLPVDAQFLDLAVEYVGKAYGEEGERGAFTRLQSHSTLQRILAELPGDMEAWILMLDSTTYTLLTSIVPISETGDKADQEDDEHIDRIFADPMVDSAIVDVVEGSLIRYFQPPYNIQLKQSFPQPTAKPLAEVYARDLNLVGATIDTRRLSLRLLSAAVRPSFRHEAVFTLHDENDRKNMLDFVDDIERLRSLRSQRDTASQEPT